MSPPVVEPNLLRWLAAHFDIPSYCGYETEDTPSGIFGIPPLRVVSMTNGLALCNRADPIPKADHITIAKPDNEQSPQYLAFREALKESGLLIDCVPMPTPSPVLAPTKAEGEPPFIDLHFKPSGTGAVTKIAISPDGKYAIVCGGSDGATVWQRNSQGGLGLIGNVQGWAFDVRFSRCGTALIAGSGVREMQLPSQETVQLLDPVPESVINSAAVSADGMDVAWMGMLPGSAIGNVGVINLRQKTKTWRSQGPVPMLPAIYFLNTESCLVTGLVNGSTRLFTLDVATRQIKDTQVSCNQFLALYPNEKTGVVTTSEKVADKSVFHIGNVAIEPPSIPSSLDTIENGWTCRSATVSVGERALAAAFLINGSESAIFVWNLTTRERVRQWKLPGSGPVGVAWSPLDGNLLVGGIGFLRLYRFTDSTN